MVLRMHIHTFFLSPLRAIDLETVKILRERVKNCQRKEGVNHPQRCRDHAIAYMTALRKYQSEGQWICDGAGCLIRNLLCLQAGRKFIQIISDCCVHNYSLCIVST